jgi:hypothetical protein
MKILSFDVGIINLAYCIFDTSNCKINNWGIIDLKVPQFSARVPSGNNAIAKSANDIHVTLIKELDNRKFLLDVDYVVIEKQPSFNPKMRIIGGCLQSYFYIRGIIDSENPITSIEFFSPKHKLKCYTGPELTIESKTKSKYVQTKKMGILITREKLNEFNETEIIKKQFESSKKQDDLADSYLQAITFSVFKKFISKSLQQHCFVEHVQSELTNSQIKRQLKQYLDSKIQERKTNGVSNLLETLDNMETKLKDSIFKKWNITDFSETIFLDDLAMKSYKKYKFLPLQVH